MLDFAHEAQRSSQGGTGSAMPLARILCVDDDARLLEGLQRVLQFDYDVVIESNPLAALRMLENEADFQVVLCDMKMPRIDGTQFLIRTRQILPAATRVLLTGVANLESLVTAVNEGGVFRFLTKPCPREQLLAAIRAAVDQHRRSPGDHLGAPTPVNPVIARNSPGHGDRARCRGPVAARARARGRCAGAGRRVASADARARRSSATR